MTWVKALPEVGDPFLERIEAIAVTRSEATDLRQQADNLDAAAERRVSELYRFVDESVANGTWTSGDIFVAKVSAYATSKSNCLT